MFPIRLWNFDALRTTATVSQNKMNGGQNWWSGKHSEL